MTDLPSPRQVDSWTTELQTDLDWLCRQGPRDKWGRAGNYHYAHSGVDGIRSASTVPTTSHSGVSDLVGASQMHSYRLKELEKVREAGEKIREARDALKAVRRLLEEKGTVPAEEGPRGRFVRTAELQALRQAQKRREKSGGYGTT